MTTAPAFWRRSEMAAAQTTTVHRPEASNTLRAAMLFLLSLLVLGSFVAPMAATAQNLGTAPQFGRLSKDSRLRRLREPFSTS